MCEIQVRSCEQAKVFDLAFLDWRWDDGLSSWRIEAEVGNRPLLLPRQSAGVHSYSIVGNRQAGLSGSRGDHNGGRIWR